VFYVIDSFLPENVDLLVESIELQRPDHASVAVVADSTKATTQTKSSRPQTNLEIAFGIEQAEDAAAKVLKGSAIGSSLVSLFL